MSNRAKRARLWLSKDRRRSDRSVRQATWQIVDYDKNGRRRYFSTGCLEGEVAAAEKLLADHITAKYRPERRQADIDEILIVDVLSIYVDDRSEEVRADKRFQGRIERLADWWGRKKLAEVDGFNCLAYAKARGYRGSARRELEDLRAAITYHRKLGLHRAFVDVLLPPKGEPRTRYFNRREAALMLWVCWRATVVQCRLGGGLELEEGIVTERHPLRHLARFILIGLYTGTRAGAIAAASPLRRPGRAWVDLDNGVFYRRAIGSRGKRKPQPPAPIPERLLAHLRRWHRLGLVNEYFVEWNGKPLKSVKTAFRSALKLAGLEGEGLSPHSLRHTAVTWALQGGAPTWQVAGLVGMSEDMVRRVYGHHHPGFMREAVDAIQRRRLPGRTPQRALPATAPASMPTRSTPQPAGEVERYRTPGSAGP